MLLDAFALSVPGRRTNNEDAICVRPELGLFVVADGMGGYEGGEVASAIAVESICELVRRTAGDADVTWPYKVDPQRSIDENEIIVATRLANERIAARRVGVLEQMGSTVAVLRIADDRAVIGHVGDSRVYRRRGGVLAQLTIDHSLLAQMIASGAHVDPDTFAWRHVVTRALGQCGEPDVQIDAARSGDVYLVCSDGLSEVLDTQEIAPLLDAPAEQACRALVDAAYAAGSRDNISAIVVRVL
jgi:PPM family protein phosphatase